MEVGLRRLLRPPPARPDRHRGRRGTVVRKIAVVGTGGSGKTVLACELARRLGIPHVELDALFWEPGWKQADPEVFRSRVLAALGGDGWVADGNYLGKLGGLVLERADLVVWLDAPLTTIARLLRRTRRRIRDGGELWGGNRETWRNVLVGRDALVPYSLRTHLRRRRRWPERLARFEYVRLRSSREVEDWLARQ